jgi:hypothetical protein
LYPVPNYEEFFGLGNIYSHAVSWSAGLKVEEYQPAPYQDYIESIQVNLSILKSNISARGYIRSRMENRPARWRDPWFGQVKCFSQHFEKPREKFVPAHALFGPASTKHDAFTIDVKIIEVLSS